MSAPSNGPIDIGETIARMQAMARDLHLQAREQAAELEAKRVEWAAADAERAQAARRGELGPEWSRLQRRIDLDETSVSDIVSGSDRSSEAAFLRTQARDRGEQLHQDMLDGLEERDDPRIAAVREDVDDIRRLTREIAELDRSGPGLASL